MSRGLRNNNPGNIRHDGVKWRGEIPSTDKSFKQFETRAYGYRAMIKLLQNYKRRHGCNTIRKMVSRWAPPSENETEAYFKFVASKVGISADADVDVQDKAIMTKIVAAMSLVENGRSANKDEIEQGWKLLEQYP